MFHFLFFNLKIFLISLIMFSCISAYSLKIFLMSLIMPCFILLSFFLPRTMMIKMNCFCGMVDQRKMSSLISSRDHCQRSSPSRTSDRSQARYEPAQNLSSGFVEWCCPVVITIHHGAYKSLHIMKNIIYLFLNKSLL